MTKKLSNWLVIQGFILYKDVELDDWNENIITTLHYKFKQRLRHEMSHEEKRHRKLY